MMCHSTSADGDSTPVDRFIVILSFLDVTFRFRGRESQTFDCVIPSSWLSKQTEIEGKHLSFSNPSEDGTRNRYNSSAKVNGR